MKSQIYLIFLVNVLQFCGAQILWTKTSIPNDLSEEKSNTFQTSAQKSSLSLSIKSSSGCVYDSVQVEWKAKSYRDSREALLAMSIVGESVAFVTPFANSIMNAATADSSSSTSPSKDYKEPIVNNGILKCNHNEEYCIPTINNVLLLQDDSRIALEFTDEVIPTLTLNDSYSLNEALDFTPPLIGHAYGEWMTPKRLEIVAEIEFVQTLFNAHTLGEKINIVPRTEPYMAELDLSGSITIRPSEHGHIHIFAVHKDNHHEILTNVTTVHVRQCNTTLLPSLRSASTASDGNTPPAVEMGGLMATKGNKPAPGSASATPQAALRMSGVYAVNGQDGIKLADSTIPAMYAGSWTLSLWVRLLEGPNGQFRSCFYKGDSLGQQRTPSAWLLPESNRFALRVSTDTNSDIGSNTNIAIPTSAWTFVSFVFENHTSSVSVPSTDDGGTSTDRDTATPSVVSDPQSSTAADAAFEGGDILSTFEFPPTSDKTATNSNVKAGSNYTISVYINGHLDVKMDFLTSSVIGNNASLTLFKDVSHSGPLAFINDLILWDAPLTPAQVKSLYSAGQDEALTRPVDASISLLTDARSSLLPSTKASQTVASNLLSSTPASTPNGPVSLSTGSSDSAETDPEETPESLYTTPQVPDEIALLVLQRAKSATLACESYETRLDLYAEAAERGSAEALYIWGMLAHYGSESSQSNNCAFDSNQPNNVEKTHDFERALLAFITAADMSYSPALLELSLALTSGFGVDILLNYDVQLSTVQLSVPLPPQYLSNVISADDNRNNKYHTVKRYKLSKLHKVLGEYVYEIVLTCQNDNKESVTKGQSVLCPLSSGGDSNTSGVSHQDPSDLALGLLYLAALHKNPEAQAILAYRYQHGVGVSQDTETAAQYSLLAAAVAANEYHRVGGQPILEADRIDDKTAREIPKGNSGDDDELIQHQIIRAKEGHVPSILAMGDLNYYGARGLARNQGEALRYYQQAADMGNELGLCGAAGMYLKGEGTPVNATRAIAMYENASINGSVRAWNGLGYIYYFGQGGEAQNLTKAFEYFMKAAETKTDSDSLFNAGYCLEHGLGTAKNITHAVELYTTAATTHGHFDSIKSLGVIYMEGDGVQRSSTTGLYYLNAARNIGPWSAWLRRGLDQYLNGNFKRSLACYFHAGETGFEVSQANTAYILRAKLKPESTSATGLTQSENAVYYMNAHKQKQAILQRVLNTCNQASDGDSQLNQCVADGTVTPTDNPQPLMAQFAPASQDLTNRLSLRQYILSASHGNKDSMLELGNCYFKGSCGLAKRDYEKASFWYTKASFLGHPLASVYLGVMSQFGIGSQEVNLARAERYYDKALESNTLETQLQLMVKGLKTSLTLKSYSFLSSFNYGMVYVVKYLWGAV